MSDCIEGYHRSYRRIVELVRKLASALDDSHAQGIVHRDVKPHNVMIDGDGELHLMDFGVAHAGDAAEKRTHDGAIIGTSVYMFPEQAGGGSANVTSDSNQYRLGAILFELLTGQKSFDGIDGDAITRLWLTGATSEVQRPPDRQTVDCKGKQWERCLHRDIEPRDRRRKLPLRPADSSAE